MLDAITQVATPYNGPVNDFAPDTPARVALSTRLDEQASERVELVMTIGGEHRLGGGVPIDVVQPHRKDAVLGTMHNSTAADVTAVYDDAVVGQQPFGGARASGTNDKARSVLNLMRWTSPRTIKETFVPATDYTYPHMT